MDEAAVYSSCKVGKDDRKEQGANMTAFQIKASDFLWNLARIWHLILALTLGDWDILRQGKDFFFGTRD